MRIDSSQIGMDSVRKYSSHTSVRFRKELLSDQWEKGDTKEDTKDVFSGTGGSLNDLYDSFQNKLSTVSITRANSNRSTRAMIGTIKQECLNYIFMLLFGDKKKDDTSMADILTADVGSVTPMTSQMVYVNQSEEFLYSEQEQTGFSTKGLVRTADGREIEFGLEVQMSRSFTQAYRREYTMAAVQLCDPLVINLDGNLPELSDQKFTFDLDQDGILDSISRLQSGSGYLAYDRNGDGTINDGSELFGTKSGDGFGDLALFDEDGNGWIDENDEIFEKLLIWTQDENGQDKLYHLKQAGVGAICLESVSTQFSLTNEQNVTNGILRNTGVFLYEDGRAGTVSHVDLAT